MSGLDRHPHRGIHADVTCITVGANSLTLTPNYSKGNSLTVQSYAISRMRTSVRLVHRR